MRAVGLMLLMSLLMVSCGDSGDKSVAVSLAQEIDLQSDDSLYTIKEAGLYFQVTIPGELMAHGDPQMNFNSARGVFQIRDAAQQIALEISPESRTWQEVLNDKQRDALFNIQWADTSKHFAIYNRVLPDGNKYDQMIISILESNSQRILVSSSPEGEYTDGDIQRMKEILSTLKLLL